MKPNLSTLSIKAIQNLSCFLCNIASIIYEKNRAEGQKDVKTRVEYL